jgi:hypothetical protein
VDGFCAECEFPTDCDDGNACTEDACFEFSCQNTPINCNDSDDCTVDSCDQEAGCQYTPVNCDDGNDCTEDGCYYDGGCYHFNTPAGNACDDGDACTGGDTCNGDGGCDSGEPVICNDFNLCTSDSCDSVLGCQYPPVDCGDGDACTEDSCDEETGCQNQPITCNDFNLCTSDSCDSVLGCQYPPVDCGDGDACTEDSCDEETGCQNQPITCNDFNLCTSDSCDSVLGCQYPPVANGTPCADNTVCNGDETCQSGICTAGTPLTCEDANVCTSDSCDAVLGCQYPPVANGTPCADDTVCNGDETCQAGTCTAGTPLSCDDGLYCTGVETCDEEEGCLDGADPVQPGKVCREDPEVHDSSSERPGWPEGIEVGGRQQDRLAYLAAGEQGLRIYDVGNPANPSQVGSDWQADGVCPNDTFFDGIAIQGRTAYIAAGLCGLLIVDVSNPAAPGPIQRIETPGWTKDVKILTSAGGRMAYLADYFEGLRIVQVSDPSAPVELGSIGIGNAPNEVTGHPLSLHVEKNDGDILVYLVTNEGFFVINANFAGLPVVLGSLDTTPAGVSEDDLWQIPESGIPQDALVMGDRAYVPIRLGGLLVVDVSNPGNPVVIQEQETVAPGHQAFFKVAAGGANVYVTEGQCGLRVFGTTADGRLAEAFFETLENPIKLGNGVAACTQPPWSQDPWAWDVTEAQGLVYVTNGVLGPPHAGSLQTIDFRQPGSLRSGCGLGAELLLLIPVLAWCRRKRGLAWHR